MKRQLKRAGRQLTTLVLFALGVHLGADYALYVADTPHPVVLPLPGWLCPIAAAAFLMAATGRVVKDTAALTVAEAAEDEQP